MRSLFGRKEENEATQLMGEVVKALRQKASKPSSVVSIDIESELNALIASCSQSEDSTLRPDTSSVLAYLMGKATPEEIESVRKALAGSADFRREFVLIVRDLDDLSEADANRSTEVLPALLSSPTTIPQKAAARFREAAAHARAAHPGLASRVAAMKSFFSD